MVDIPPTPPVLVDTPSVGRWSLPNTAFARKPSRSVENILGTENASVSSQHRTSILRLDKEEPWSSDTMVRFLQNHSLFKGLDQQFVARMSTMFQVRMLNDRESIIRKGDIGRALFFTARGEVEVVSEDGETILNVLKEETFFGEIGVLFSVPRTATCRARGRCLLLSLTKDKLEEVMSAYPAVREAVGMIAAERFAAYEKQTKQKMNVDFQDEMAVAITKEDLRMVPLFKDCTVKFLHSLALKLIPEQYAQGADVFKHGDLSAEMYFVVRGTAEVYRPEEQHVFATISPGSFFGEVGILFNLARSASVRASSQFLDVFKLTKSDLDEVLQSYPDIAVKIRSEAQIRMNAVQARAALATAASAAVASDFDVLREQLKSAPLFKDCDNGCLHSICLALKLKVIPAGEYLVRKGDKGDVMFLVAMGTAEVVSESGDAVYAEIAPGSFLGEVALFYDVSRTASVRARGDLTVFELAKGDLERVLKEYPSVEDNVRQKAAENYEQVKLREAKVKQVIVGDAPTENRAAEKERETAYDVEATAERLKKVALFKDCTTSFLKQLAINTSIHSYRKGDYIVRKGDVSSDMFFIVHGSVQVVADDGQTVYDVMSEGSFFGEVGIHYRIARTASIRVDTETCNVVILASSALEEALNQYPDMIDMITLEAQKRFQLMQERSQQKVPEPSSVQKLPVVSGKSSSENMIVPALQTASPKIEREKSKKRLFIVSTQTVQTTESVSSVQETGTTVAITPITPVKGIFGMFRKSGKKSKWFRSSEEADTALDVTTVTETEKGGDKKVDRERKRKCSAQKGRKPDSSLLEHKERGRNQKSRRIFALDKGGRDESSDKPKKTLKASILALFGFPFGKTKIGVEPFFGNVKLRKSAPSRTGPCQNLLQLDDVLFFLIFQYFTEREKARLSLVCRAMCELVDQPEAWPRIDIGSDRQRDCLDSHVVQHICFRAGNNLQHANFAGCWRLQDVDVVVLVRNCPAIKTLNLSNCWKITDLGFQTVSTTCSRMISLNVSYCSQMSSVTFSNHAMRHLQYLDVTYCKQLGDEGLEHLFQRAGGIRELKLRRCTRVTDFGLFLVAKYCRLLHSLDLSDCEQVSDKCLKWIATACSNLVNLNLTFCRHITNGGLYDLSSGSQSFTWLDFSHCSQLTDQAIACFAESIKKLQFLRLRSCRRITDESADFLSRSAPQLLHLDVTGCPLVSSTTKLMIASRLPRCKVVMDVSKEERGLREPAYKPVEVPRNVLFTKLSGDTKKESRNVRPRRKSKM